VAGSTTNSTRLGGVALALDRVRRRGELPVVLGFDVEPDGRAFDPDDPGGWDGFVELQRLMPPIRERLSRATSAPAMFSWFLRMDPQIDQTWGTPAWVVDQWGGELAALEREGDELGLHTHDWRWNDDVGDWVGINEDPVWEEHVVGMAIDTFRTALGRPAVAHRGGAHMLTPTMLGALARGGIEVDLTIEAGMAPHSETLFGERNKGVNADYRLAPSTPYRASLESFPAPDPASRSAPLLMPLAAAPTRRGKRAPLPIWSGPGGFAGRLALRMLRSSPPVLAFVCRSDIVFQPVWPFVLANLEHLASHRGVRFVTASAAATPFLAAVPQQK
jgi:peptidoglycan/xylan/chitin deacetylase (PgdA/CDA1 family)